MCSNKFCRGFTLIEVVTSLIILGFIALSLGNGLIYSTQLYRTAKTADPVMLQFDAAAAIIRQVIKDGKAGNLNLEDGELVDNIQVKGGLTLTDTNGKHLLLDHVKTFTITSVDKEENVKLVKISFDFDEAENGTGGNSDDNVFKFYVFQEP